jgi:probable HAF family extracellular repeat protein
MKRSTSAKRWTLLTFGAPLLSAVGLAAQTPTFTVQLLGKLSSDESAYVYGINDAGEAVGQVGVLLNGNPSPACPYECAVIWHDGTPTKLEIEVSYASEAYAINNSGQIVGDVFTAGSELGKAVVWNNGSPTLLPSPAPQYTITVAISINDAGQVVGYAAISDESEQAIEWNGVTPTVLGTTCAGSSIATSVNRDGIIVGVTLCPPINGPYNRLATVWLGTTPTLLSRGGFHPKANAINNAGLIVGESLYGATAWVGGVVTLLGGSMATAVNDLGVIVGKAQENGLYHAALWSDVSAAPQDLNTLIGEADRKYVLTEATGVNGSCTIVANGYLRNDPYNSAAFLLKLTDPSSCGNGVLAQKPKY